MVGDEMKPSFKDLKEGSPSMNLNPSDLSLVFMGLSAPIHPKVPEKAYDDSEVTTMYRKGSNLC